MMKEKEYCMVSLFSGCGGLDLGFKNAGFNILFANDFDKDAQRVYEKNFGKIDYRDIRTINEKEIPDCDLLSAGFPCQPFSNAGNRKGLNDYRGNLFFECLRIIKEKRPKAIVCENVRGLLSSKDDEGKPVIDIIKESLDKAGYDVWYKLVNASDYGVPQNRFRLIIVGFRKELKIKYEYPEPKKDKTGLALGNLLNVSSEVKNQVHWQFSPQAEQMITYIPEGGSWKNVPYDVLPERFKNIKNNMEKYHSPNMYRRFARNEIAGTITASAQPDKCGIIHPTENRRFTVREVARIQSFPDSFEFITEKKSDIQKMYKVIGNAVPPQLAYEIALSIKKHL